MQLPFIFIIDKQFWEVSNLLRGKIGDLGNMFPEKELPLRIDVTSSSTGLVLYSIETYGHSWFEKWNFYYQDILVYTSSGRLICEQRWNMLEDPAYLQFYILNCFKDTTGIVS